MVLMKLLTGFKETNLTIGGNVTERITPETYEKMNEEFIEEGLAFRIIVPTQEQIDAWQESSND
jgi:effector-binding domain-containing protein